METSKVLQSHALYINGVHSYMAFREEAIVIWLLAGLEVHSLDMESYCGKAKPTKVDLVQSP